MTSLTQEHVEFAKKIYSEYEKLITFALSKNAKFDFVIPISLDILLEVFKRMKESNIEFESASPTELLVLFSITVDKIMGTPLNIEIKKDTRLTMSEVEDFLQEK